ncbi:MAG: hypothetical protein BWK76_21675 [Desulfobulbaceae bacterium A2]|nr:MAG: hypothetical protein BWK76_21675 [Desulfobulbaceae bacterium A2]
MLPAICCWAVLVLVFPDQASPQTVQIDAKVLQQLQDTVLQQKEQIRNQAATLDALLKQINELQQHSAPPHAPAAQAPSPEPPVAKIVPGAIPPVSFTAGEKQIKVNISGQVNRAVTQADDSQGNEYYFVDHSTSGSRVNLTASTPMGDNLTLGSRIEVAIAPDNSALVSQSNQSPGDSFNQRWAEVSLAGKRYGKLSLGKGDTASNTTAEADLSGTLAVQNSSVSDIVYGMLFREREGKRALTTIKLSTAFSNLDGLSRESRLRYDTPSFHGFSLASSLVSKQRSDAALYWDGQGYGFKSVARAAIADPNLPQAGLRYDGSFSVLHNRSGLNFTCAAGMQESDLGADDTNLYGKIGWLARLNHFGPTAFIIDSTWAENTPAAHDVGYATGLGVNQFFDEFNTELYLQYRRFSLDRFTGPAVGDLKATTLGARFRF